MTDYRPNPLRRRLAEGGIGVIAIGPNTADMCDFLLDIVAQSGT